MVLELLLLLLPHVAAASVAAPAWQLTTPLRRHAPPQLALAPAEVRPRRRQQREDARVAVRFVPSFKAAQRARGVVHGSGDSSEYVVTPRASPAEIRAMLNGLCSTGQLEPAISLLAHRLATSARGSDAEGLSSIVLNACANAGRMDLTRGVLTAMREHHVPIGLLTFCILIKGYGRAGDVDRVTRTYTAMQQLRLAPDLATLNALLDAYARNGRLAEAEGVLVEMDKAAVEPSSRTYNTLIKGYSNAHRLQEAFGVVRRMRSALGPNGPNEVTYSTLIHACVRDGQLGRARTILSWLGDDANPLRPDVWAYTALLRGLLADSGGGARRVDEALALLDEMLKLGVSPNEATVSTLITGCFDRGNVPRALQAFQTAKKELPSLQLDKVTFGTLINGLTRPYGANNNVASARRALQLWAEMRLLGLAPDARIVTPLFDACTRHVGVETVLKLRVELVRMGWNVAALRPHDQVLIAALPSLKEVLRDQPKWEALGVRLPPTLGSEQAQLSLTMPALPTAVVPPAATSVPRAGRAEFEHDDGTEVPCVVEDDECAAQPASAGEEIWERHAWNSMDGSWRYI
ncbi:pentatricopeptide repeat-containing [Chrysochromulina tobinii]|uniref:Pentatricopeptide repeat-containing n=1 Tax=Chrysochromulina tobinii TaxID=1460289 RepID=A0A0M0K4N5_9EUKA|nr:pentatricopeptide repeat-containing [Chrysochromulina tobinii]|eukprot:KOO33769.1 pentatricopeptide repeat-containing [Chrysochromulina sp. CCMP291]